MFEETIRMDNPEEQVNIAFELIDHNKDEQKKETNACVISWKMCKKM